MARASELTFPDGRTLVVSGDGSAAVRALRSELDRRGLQLDVVKAPAQRDAVGRVIAVLAPRGARRTESGFALPHRSGATTVVIGRAPRAGEQPVEPAALAALAHGAARRLSRRLVLSPSNHPTTKESSLPTSQQLRRVTRGALSAAVLITTAAVPAVAATLPDDTAEVRVMSHHNGVRNGIRIEQITGSDGRFATRTYDAEGTLIREWTDDGRRGLQWSRDSGRVESFDVERGTHEDRFEQWELTYRAQIRMGATRIAGETTVDGRPAYELVNNPASKGPAGATEARNAGQEGVVHVFVDRETWIPLRSELHDAGTVTVMLTTTSSIVPLSEAESLLQPSAAVRKARARAALARRARAARRAAAERRR
ncbi:MAG TPA: hypothetical protein VGW75_15405 [Solirubrobacteraceae bacterium]|nr:hypothetical protein [Solirubrobacteraceae bacterium]